MLPPPTLSFTIPSIHDNLPLHCRVYHPACLSPTTTSGVSGWRKKAAIVAHPYAPLGGCYDDPVVDLVASTILKQGFVVGTFNFRGAGNSKGRTSWQSKPEQSDYMSFIGFMIYYLHHLTPPHIPSNVFQQPDLMQGDIGLHDLSPIQSQAVAPSHDYDQQDISITTNAESANEGSPQDESNLRPVLLLAGYSYGAMITCCLPPIISSIINPFQIPSAGSAYSEIRLRAFSLAMQQNSILSARVNSLYLEGRQRRGRSLQIEDHNITSPKFSNAGGSVRMGGGEDIRRASHESYRSRHSLSLDSPVIIRSVDKFRSMGKNGKLPSHRPESRDSFPAPNQARENLSEESSTERGSNHTGTIEAIPGVAQDLQAAYLLISPLQGMVSGLATMWSTKSARERDSIPEHELKFTVDPTLALFGDDDVFVSVKKLRTWVEKLRAAKRNGEGCFRYREVLGAGHFWHDHEAVQILVSEVKGFVRSL